MPTELPPGMAAQRPDRNPESIGRQLWTLASGIVIAIAVVIWSIGAVGDRLVQWIPPSVEQQLGSVMAAQFEAQAEVDSPQQQALTQLLHTLTPHLPSDDAGDRTYRIWYIPENTVNALALPGNQIIIYDGLLAKVESENALAMVLGHELGHFAHRDHLRGLGRTIVWQLALGSLFGDVSAWQRLAIAGIEQLSQAQYSQRQETQADEFGLVLLNAAYGHVGGATDFFAQLAELTGASPVAFLATHPVPAARVKRLEQEIEANNYAIAATTPLPAALQP